MTSYNFINGVRTSESAELITGILRGEWGYKGLVTTDWFNTADRGKEVLAGNDIHMPSEDARPFDNVDRNSLAICVKRLLEMILWFE